MTTRIILAVLVLILTAAQSPAQVPVQQVTGSAVPDVAAFRLLLWHQDSACSFRHLDLRLSGSDMAILKQACMDFQKLPEIKPGASINMASHHATVRVYWSNLQAQMSTDGLTRFTAFLQDWKSKVSLSPYDDDLPNAAQNLAEASMVAALHPMAGMMQGVNMQPNYSGVFNEGVDMAVIGWDNFTRANGPVGGNWLIQQGSFSITNNSLTWPSGTNYMYNNTGSKTDQHATIWVGNIVANNTESVLVRGQLGAQTFYMAHAWLSGGSSISVDLYLCVNGTYTHLGKTFLRTQAYPWDYIDLSAEGNHISVSYNGVTTIASAVDSTLSSGYPGIMAWGGTSGASIAYFQAYSGWEYYSDISINGNTICGIGPGGCTGAVHTPGITNTFGSLGGTVTGQSVPPQNTIGINNNQTYLLSSIVPRTNPTATGTITCSHAGNFWNLATFTSGSQYGFQWMLAEAEYSANGTTNTTFPITPNCTSASSPPDIQKSQVFIQDEENPGAPVKGVEFLANCTRHMSKGAPPNTIPWNCAFGATDYSETAQPAAVCTNFDKLRNWLILFYDGTQ